MDAAKAVPGSLTEAELAELDEGTGEYLAFDELIRRLVAEVRRLRAENAKLKDDLEQAWQNV